MLTTYSSLRGSRLLVCWNPRTVDISHIVQVHNSTEDVSHMPEIKDRNVLNANKPLMAADWEALPYAVVHDTENTISKNTEDKAGYQLALIL
ncbi:hypothetical protein F2Q70_00039272 [Brassica cretica]|uniref:Uncharacterized protein n=1 Tax=Brassica cretica TaxID=69181 RepID=A0A8S9MJU0_BRACR|nr:hypothetical protein F2Q70_00039272 [Brassica cretica]KAF2620215.1 hypothetical protein F2Q68_00039970 [Brassica cretica]